MARKQSNGRRNAAAAREAASDVTEEKKAESSKRREWFATFAHATSQFTGKPATFIVAVLLVIVWAATGPIFNYSDTWQLVINTSTTIITFLMVFLIQNTQNRDTLALQVKLAELIIAMSGAKNKIANAEDLSEEDLEKLHEDYRCRADATLSSLERRRAAKAKS